MPVWNAALYLREAVDGILSQTFSNFELIAVDDGSDDESVAILQSYGDPRIRIIQQGRKGFVAAVTRGVAESSADWIARHDADDISDPRRLELQWDSARKRPDTVLVFCQTETFGESTTAGLTRRIPRSRALIALRSCHQCPVVVGAALMRKDAYLEAKGYQEEDFPAEDFAFASRLIKIGRFQGRDEILYRIRSHESQISQVKRNAQIQQTRRISRLNIEGYFRVSGKAVDEILATLCWEHGNTSFHKVLNLVIRLIRFRPQSLELWYWAANRLFQSLRH